MPKTQEDNRPAATEGEDERRRTALAGRVLHALGQADALRRVEVRQLWDGHYRVNILVGEDAASVRIAHSFFVVTDGDGAILTSTPQINRQY